VWLLSIRVFHHTFIKENIRAMHGEKCKFNGGIRVNATDWPGDTSEELRELTPGHRIDF
jgi:hypothetical protein